MKNESDRDILLVAVFTFFTVLLWIFFELVKTTKTTTVTLSTQSVIVPLTSKIDTDTLSILETRNTY